VDGSPTGLNAGLYNGESKAYSTALSISYGLRTIKGFEKVTDSVFGYAGTLVGYRQKDFGPFLVCRDLNGPRRARIS